MAKWLARILLNRLQDMLQTPPHFIVGGKHEPYLLRWHLLPRNSIFNIYLHQFHRSDDDRAHHDHPYLFNASFLLKGRYLEHVIAKGGTDHIEGYSAGNFKLRLGPSPHRIEILPNMPCVTLFFCGPRVRVWQFHCPKRNVPWHQFVDDRDSGAIGKGCDL